MIEGERGSLPPLGLHRAEAYRHLFGPAGASFTAVESGSPGVAIGFPVPHSG